MNRIIIQLLRPYLPRISSSVIDRLLRDNDRLNQQWREKYAAMEQEKWYWHDKYIDEVVYEPDDADKS